MPSWHWEPALLCPSADLCAELLGKWDFHEKHKSGQLWDLPEVTTVNYSLNFVFSGHSVWREALSINMIAVPLTEHPLFYKHTRSPHPCSEEFTICKAQKAEGKSSTGRKDEGQCLVSGTLCMQAQTQQRQKSLHLHLQITSITWETE